jgi:uncharacterized Ntn-hydrolase superfamily protein
MSVDQMCLWLEMHENEKYKAIIAALKAGQAMRAYGRECIDSVDEWYAAEEAWDAATKEDV